MKNIEASQLKKKGEIHLPLSKSISNRLMVMRFLSGLKPDEHLVSDADDSRLLRDILSSDLHANTEHVFDVKNAGTVMRFLTALLAITPGTFILSGSQRMSQRPIRPLVRALQKIGADITYLDKEGFAPLRIKGKTLAGGSVYLDSSLSSQYVSALLMIAPYLKEGLRIHLSGKRMSSPYISMTVGLMTQLGAQVDDRFHVVEVAPGSYRQKDISVEADWSSAAFFYEMAALMPGSEYFLKDLKESSLQGDAIMVGLFSYLGVESRCEAEGVRITRRFEPEKNITVDFSDYPDLALPYITTCAALQVIGRFSGLETLKHKESNRLEALQSELAKFEYDFRENGFGEWILINSCKTEGLQTIDREITIDCRGDHRVAMALAPLASVCKKLSIREPQVVEKSFPDYWDNLLE